jgi:single-strand DNA-binding protein
MAAAVATETDATTERDTVTGVNEVRLVGRISGTPEERTLPSGDVLVLSRLVVRRPAARRSPPARAGGSAARTRSTVVDTLDVACWAARPRRAALRLQDGDAAEVTGSLHRRFFRAGGAAASRYEVAAATVAKARS